MTQGKYQFIKLLNDCEFEWMNCEIIKPGQFKIISGKIKTHFPENITMMLRYEYSFQITARLWQKIAEINYENTISKK